MANTARGEVDLTLAGKSFPIGLNLGALAAIESKFAVDSFEKALDFTTPSANRILAILETIVEGNGIALGDAEKAELSRWTLPEFHEFVGKLMSGNAMKDKVDAAAEGESAPLAAPSDGASGSASA